MLTNKQRDELLIRIDERVEKLRADMKEAKGLTGFARCQVHKAQVDSVQRSIIWGRRLIIGGIAGAIIKGLWPNITKFFSKGGL